MSERPLLRRASSDASDIVPSPNTLIHFCGDKHIPALLDICGTGGPSLRRYRISADRPSSHEPSRHRRILACWSSGVRVGAKAGWRQLCQICQMGDVENRKIARLRKRRSQLQGKVASGSQPGLNQRTKATGTV